MKRTERSVAYTLSTRVQTTLLMVLQSVAFTRLIGVEGRGLYAKLQAGLNLSLLLFGFGLTAGLSTYLANKKVKTEEALSLAFLVWVVGQVVLLLTLEAFHLWPRADLIFPAGFRTEGLIWYFYLSFAFALFQLLLSSALLGQHQFDQVNRLDLWSTVARTSLFAGLWLNTRVFPFEISLMWAFSLDVVLVFFKTSLMWFAFRKEFSSFTWPFQVRLTSALRLLRFSSFVYIASVLTFLYLRIDYWLVERTLGLAALGVYSVAAGLAQYMTIVPVALASVMGPLIASARTGGGSATDTLKYFSRLNVTATGFLTLALVIFGTPLIRLMYGAAFSEASPILKVLAVSFFFLSVKFLFTNYQAASDRAHKNLLPEVVGLAVGLTLNLLLLKRFGIMGACWASLGANLSALIYVCLQLMNEKDMPRRGFVRLKKEDALALIQSLLVRPEKELA